MIMSTQLVYAQGSCGEAIPRQGGFPYFVAPNYGGLYGHRTLPAHGFAPNTPMPWISGGYPRPYYRSLRPYPFEPPVMPPPPGYGEDESQQDRNDMSGAQSQQGAVGVPSAERGPLYPFGNLSGRYEKTDDGRIFLYPDYPAQK